MPLARFALYERGVEIYLAPTADDSDDWHASLRHIARESRAFVLSSCSFQRASSYPADVPLADGNELIDRGGSAILAPDGSYLAGPLWDEEGILYADLEPSVLHAARQRFDPAGHYHRPDVLSLTVTLARHDLGDRGRRGRLRRLDGARAGAPRARRDASSSSTRPAPSGRAPAATHGSRAPRTVTSSGTRTSRSGRRTLWLELQEETGTQIWEPVGVAWFAQTDDGFEAQSRVTLEAAGVACEWLSPDDARSLYPSLGVDDLSARAVRARFRRPLRAPGDAAAGRGRHPARRPARDARREPSPTRRAPTSWSGPAARGCRSSSPSTSSSGSRGETSSSSAPTARGAARPASATTTRRSTGTASSAGSARRSHRTSPARRSTPTGSTGCRCRRSSRPRARTPRSGSRRSPTHRSSARASASTS